MNYYINSVLNKIPRVYRIIACSVVGVAIVLLLWFYGMRAVNGVSSWWFAKQSAADKQKIAAQQKEIESTLLELAKAKGALEEASKERELREKIFNDKNKSAQEKVAEYHRLMSRAPEHTDPTGLSTSDLCQRAKDIGASPSTITALCGGG